MKKLQTTMLHVIVLQKNMRSMHSSERIEEMVCELEGTDGMLYCCVKRGGMLKKKYGRHIINTF